MRFNSIFDISPLAGLNNLTELFLANNSIADISPLAGLNNLTELFLANNSIADISPLAGLNNLTRLSLDYNSISDISALSGLINLIWLSLLGNSISDLSPLVANTGLGQGDAIFVNGNPLNNASINTHIPALQRRGVRVDFDDLDLTPVDIPDTNLRAAIEKALGKASGATITTEDIAYLTRLSALFANISDLTGLEAATNLTELFLANNSISDISPLAGLNNLTLLSLDYNPISDISALSGLINLIWLSLLGNSISDLSPLVANTGLGQGDAIFVNGNPLNNASINTHIPALQRRGVRVDFDDPFDKPVDIPDSNLRTAIEKALRKASGVTITTEDMKSLYELEAPNASITDLTGLEHATSLTWLILNNNSISDISPLKGLTNLVRLDLNNNSISDISPLVANTGLGPGNAVLVEGNLLNNASINTHIPTLISRGVRVDFDNPFDKPVDIPDSNLRTAIEKALGKASGVTITTEWMKRLYQLIAPNASITDLTGLEGATKLTWLELHNNFISDISPLKGLTNLRRLELHNNSISDISPLVANTGLGPGDVIIVNGNPLNNASINTHIPTLISRGVRVDFDKLVDIPDSNLRTAIEKALGKASGVTITTEDMKHLPQLIAPNASITDLTGLEGATNLELLELGNNFISDISPLKGLTNLVRLDLNNNSISDISPLKGLTNLKYLLLDNNSISDISPLKGLTNLRRLELHNNSISDISPLVANTGLGEGDLVEVSENPLNPVSINTHILALVHRRVTVHFDKLVDIPDSNLRTAIEKALGKASGVTITTEDMKSLYELEAPNASITDLTGLEHATNLTLLTLSDNSISDISPLAGLNNLAELYLSDNSISDISPLKGLNNLIWLELRNNSISDISPLKGLNNLAFLYLEDNSISDISPLVANTGLGPRDTVIVNGNPLNNAAINTHIPTLISRGVRVDFDKPVNIIPDSNLRTAIEDELGKASGDTITTEDMKRLYQLIAPNASITDLTGLEGATNLTWLILHNNSISDISPLKGLTNLRRLELHNNSISDLSLLVANTGLGSGDVVLVNGNPLNNAAINTHILTLQRRGVRVDFDKPVDIPDPNLRAEIEKDLSTASGVTITTEDMKRLTQLIAPNASITDLTGLEHATNLIRLELGNNFISDLSPLKRLTNLTRLDLNNNSISDLSPLADNTGLGPRDTVIVNGNPLNNAAINTHIPTLISRGVRVDFDKPVNIIPDSNLRTAIEDELGKASGDTITTEDMKRLTQLIAPNASITDLTGLEGATNLTLLELGNNFISDISPLKGLTNLVRLELHNNSISDISPLKGLTNLRRLELHNNSISDLSLLVANTGLGSGDVVLVNGNPLNNASINTHIPTLQRRGVRVDFDKPVDIPDPNLRAEIEKDLSKASGAPITTADMKRLYQLIAPKTNIRNLTGLEHATNLIRLELGNNFISDLSPLKRLTNLTRLDLNNNSISDLSPLADNTGLGPRDTVIVNGNPLNNAAINTHIPTLISRGVRVDFDKPVNIIPDSNLRTAIEKALGKASGVTITTEDMANLTVLRALFANISDLTGLEGATNLTLLELGNNSISDISPLKGLTNLRRLELHNNSISDISPLVANTGLGPGDVIIVNGNPLNNASINTHIPTLISRGVRVDFDKLVDIPDSNLRTAIEKALGKASGVTITTEDMANLTVLRALFANISDLTGLEHATNLTLLNLPDNSISDISPLAGLNNLAELYLSDNSISDISPLAGLNNLIWLELHNNSISDLSPLKGLNNLISLELSDNSISDISPLAGLTNLRILGLSGNSISDISPLAGLTNLRILGLSGNSISDISPVAGLINLIELSLENNSISDISPLVANTGLGPGNAVLVEGNLLNNAAINTHIPTLQRRGVRVDFDKPVDIPDPNLRAEIEKDLSKASGAPITTADMKRLYQLIAPKTNIRNLTGLEHATNLTLLDLGNNFISDLSPLKGLTNLRRLELHNNSISDLSPLVANTGLGPGDVIIVNGNPLNNASINTHIPTLISRGVRVDFDKLVDIPDPNLRTAIEKALGKASSDTITTADMKRLTDLEAPNANITDLTGLEHATNLTLLDLDNNSISDISPLTGLTQLTVLFLGNNSISDISPLTGLTNLKTLVLENNSISDISPLAGLTNLTQLRLYINSISDISPLAGLTQLTSLGLGRNNISDISPLAGLTNLTTLTLWTNSISDLSPLVANTGLGEGDRIDVSENPLNSASINTHIPALQSRGVEVYFDALEPATPEYLLSIPAGISLIHVPLKVTTVDGVPKTIESISNLYDALGGASKVNFLITYDSQTQEWRSYFGASDRGGLADVRLADDKGIIASLRAPVSVRLTGNPLGTNGSGTITINPGLNLVGLPLNDSRINRVSDLFALDGIGGNVPVIILTDGGEFKLVGRADDPGDIEITGGQAFIMTASREAAVDISGDGWTNVSGTAAAPPMALTGIEVGDTTPVLGLRGAVVDQGTGVNQVGLRVTVKNLSTRRAVAAVTGPDAAGYQLTVVDIETGRAAQIGDILEISAQSPNPFIGVKPLRYTVTAEDVKQSPIQLPELVSYEIPAETELLHNYPNPFNPETWIPYRLAEDAFVTLTIYDLNGQIVRTLDVGHQTAAVYENRSKAVYWDGRNGLGEQVASGVYFYHLSAGEFSATRKMVILK